jgi:serine/threonine protein kinase
MYSDKKSFITDCTKLKIKQLKIDESSLVGKGGFGSVYPAVITYKGKDINVVLKIIVDKNLKDAKYVNESIKNFYLEVQYSIKMGEQDIGPSIYDSFYSIKNKSLYQYIIMERFDMSVDKWMISKIYPKGSKYIVTNMLEILKNQIFNKHMYCTDIKPQNYVIKIGNDGVPYKVRMIDFGSDFCGKDIPSIYITYPSLRVLSKNTLDEVFYVVCVIQLFMFIYYSFNKLKFSIHALKYFYTDKLFVKYIVKRDKNKDIDIMLVLYDILQTEKEHAEIFKHYMNDNNESNENLVKGIFEIIDDVTNSIF